MEIETSRITVLKDVVSCLDIGIGWNSSGCLNSRWPEYLGLGFGGAGQRLKRKFSQEEWDRYFGLMEWSGCHWLRHAVSISDWMPHKGNTNRIDRTEFVFDSEEMQRHYTVLDQAEKRGIKVLLANWNLGTRWATKSEQPKEKRSHANWNLGSGWLIQKRIAREDGWSKQHPDNEDVFAEALAALVYHLKREKKYQCVWALSLWNEPNGKWEYSGSNANYPDSFWPLYGAVDSHLRHLGVRDEVRLLGPDTSTGGHPRHIFEMLEKYGPILDIVADHDYSAFRGKAMFRSVTAYTQLMRNIEDTCGKRIPLVISEFGNYGKGNGSVDDDNQVYDGALSTTAYLIRMLNHGTAGLARWEFLIYGNEWRNFGALTNTDVNYLFRPYGPVFYPHAIAARYVKPGWEVRKVQSEDVSTALWATALTSKQGNITILLLNDDIKPVSLRLRLDVQSAPKQLHHLMVTGPIPKGIQSGDDLALDKGEIEIALPPKSISALTSLSPGNLDLPGKLALKRGSRDKLFLHLHWMRKRFGSLRRYRRNDIRYKSVRTGSQNL